MARRSEYQGPADLLAMQSLAQRTWSPASRWHIGDLAWGRQSIPEQGSAWRTALWWHDEEVAAWGWAELPGHLELLVDPAHPGLADEFVAWFDEFAGAEDRTCTVLETEDHLVRALTASGYRQDHAAPFFTHHTVELSTVDRPQLPAGFALRTVAEGEAGRRAEAHRLAWSDLGPSRVSAQGYAAIMATWPYEARFDQVVVAPDGTWVANALGWLDAANGVGLLEPVGCAPAYRRQGLARAVNLAVLHAMRAAGATRALVGPRGDAGYPVPEMLYRGIGFRPVCRTLTFTRRAAAGLR